MASDFMDKANRTVDGHYGPEWRSLPTAYEVALRVKGRLRMISTGFLDVAAPALIALAEMVFS